MARIPRALIVFPNYVVHKVWRGHNKENNLKTDQEKAAYMECLNKDLESKRFDAGCELQAVTLMTNHPHEVTFVKDPVLFSAHMRRAHSRYGMFFNRLHNRSGEVGEGRPHTTLLETQKQEMETVFYVHANPVRANMVKDATQYYWSTHRLYALGKRAPWMKNIRFPQWYLGLAKNPELRQRAYRKLYQQYLEEKGRLKASFLKRPFYGSAPWCQKLKEAIRIWLKKEKPPP